MAAFQRFLALVIAARFLFIGLICYYLWFLFTHHDFYIGIGLSDLSLHSYLLIATGLGVIGASVLLWKKHPIGWKTYLFFKILDLAIWIFALSPILQTLSRAVSGLDSGPFVLVFSGVVVITHVLFMLSFYYHYMRLKA